ncbi:putative endo-1,3(4)-beta-glucanase [Pseudocercospora fuligena]|uniref:Putative endo-1,3(4)-beta-glucanase n=1 Tax=Pseudocercospora fuligena TaxID=685502 RepID=A0A8H6RSL4_9PEZI|nr:putative endo-1,3(4)-beta-glucanase [Pseudocercospora fuligena]
MTPGSLARMLPALDKVCRSEWRSDRRSLLNSISCSVTDLRYIAGGGVPGSAPYQLVDDYNSTNFFDKFFFFNSPDPTNGYVQYVNKSVALQNGFVNVSNRGTMIIKPDTTNVYPRYSGSPGRPSVRLESLNAYFHGLFIYDTTHMPVGCGVWPAYWQDVIEGTSLATLNSVSMYTGPGSNCSVAGSGCKSQLRNMTALPNNYGAPFNNNQGGVYVTEWTSSFIKIWWFPRGRVPASITAGTPDPSQFGIPAVNAQGACDFDANFENHTIIINIDFCGSYAGSVYTSSYPSCPQSNATAGNERCKDFVGDNPGQWNHMWSFT